VQSLRVGVPILGAIGLAVAAALTPIAARPTDRAGLPAAEDVRAALFLASQPDPTRWCVDDALVTTRLAACTIDDHGDIDGDGRADCWRVRHDELASQLTVWPGCRGSGTQFEIGHAGTSLLVIPRELATSTWLAWIARRVAGRGSVACDGAAIPGCASPGPEWGWLLASADRRRAQPGWYGTVAPRWSDGDPVTAPGALIVPHVRAGWMAHYRGSEEDPPPDAPEGARIIVEAGDPPRAGPISCGGLEIRSGRRGITANTGGRWTWLFRGLADYGGFAATKLVCIDGIVIASTGGDFASVAAIDPRTGGWLFAPNYDAGPGAEVSALPDGDVLWRDEYGHVISVAALRDWLATPFAQRTSIDALYIKLRPELADPTTGEVSMSRGSRDPEGMDELSGDRFDPAAVASQVRASLVARGTCAGWKIASSRTTILAERGAQARWLYVEDRMYGRRITDVRCIAGRVVATRAGPGGDLLEKDPPAPGVTHTLTFDLANGWWRVR
jgi:hypothetical protein